MEDAFEIDSEGGTSEFRSPVVGEVEDEDVGVVSDGGLSVGSIESESIDREFEEEESGLMEDMEDEESGSK